MLVRIHRAAIITPPAFVQRGSRQKKAGLGQFVTVHERRRQESPPPPAQAGKRRNRERKRKEEKNGDLSQNDESRPAFGRLLRFQKWNGYSYAPASITQLFRQLGKKTGRRQRFFPIFSFALIFLFSRRFLAQPKERISEFEMESTFLSKLLFRFSLNPIIAFLIFGNDKGGIFRFVLGISWNANFCSKDFI